MSIAVVLVGCGKGFKSQSSSPVAADTAVAVEPRCSVPGSCAVAGNGPAAGNGSVNPVSNPVAAPPATTTTMPAANTTIDTLNYFLTKHPGQALAESATAPQFINQVIDEAQQRVYLMKWGPKSFIGYSWDSDYIYFREEHEMDFPGATAQQLNYSFSPGYWLKRNMQVGDVLDGTATGPFHTTISYYDSPHSCGPGGSSAYPMKTILEAHYPAFNLGGDLGVQDVIALRIEQGSFSEKEWYSSEWGLVQWQHCTLDGTSCDLTATFNYRSRQLPKAVDRHVACETIFQSTVPSSGNVVLDQIRELSLQYFGAISSDTPSVETQLNYVANGGSIDMIDGFFRTIKQTWINDLGSPPPSYPWVNLGMTFLIGGGTQPQYSTAVEQAIAKYGL